MGPLLDLRVRIRWQNANDVDNQAGSLLYGQEFILYSLMRSEGWSRSLFSAVLIDFAAILSFSTSLYALNTGNLIMQEEGSIQ